MTPNFSGNCLFIIKKQVDFIIKKNYIDHHSIIITIVGHFNREIYL